MGFNAPLLGVAWNPKQHCVAMAAAGGSYPVLVAYSERVEHVASPGGQMGGGMMQGNMMMGGMMMGSPTMATANALHGSMGANGSMFDQTALTNTLGHHQVAAGGVAGGGGGGGVAAAARMCRGA